MNNQFVTEDKRIKGRKPLDQANRDHFEPQRFQPMIKANNCFIVEDTETYRRYQENGHESESVFNQAANSVNEVEDTGRRYVEQTQRNSNVGKNSINQENTERNQVQQGAVNQNSNFERRPGMVVGNTTDSITWEENRQREYRDNKRDTPNDRQFLAPQEQQTGGRRKSKAVQVDHVEEQYVIRRNTFSGKNPLYTGDTERPVFVNNYYAGDNPQQMFREMKENPGRKKDHSYYCLEQFQIRL